jgi:hypothetical protein
VNCAAWIVALVFGSIMLAAYIGDLRRKRINREWRKTYAEDLKRKHGGEL